MFRILAAAVTVAAALSFAAASAQDGPGAEGKAAAAQGKAAQSKAAQGKAMQGKAGKGKPAQGEAGQDEAGQGKAAQDKAAQDKTGQNKTGQDRTGQDGAGPEENLALPEGAIAPAKKCPVGDAEAEKAGSYSAAVEAAVRDAPDCEKAFAALEACQLGSSADNALSEIVREKCEPLFLPKAKPTKKEAYKKAQDRCNEIAEKTEGSMYQSFTAVCLAGAARDFAKKGGRAR